VKILALTISTELIISVKIKNFWPESHLYEESLSLGYMKEELCQLWRQQNKSQAEELLISWAKRAEASGIQMLKKFGHMHLARKNGILAYYDNRLSTGPVEGFNNKIKTIQRQAYGYRDQEFFRLKVYASHEAKFKLVG
jgi:transposase